VIGEIFDKVWLEGGVKFAQEHVQTTMVPSGGAVMVEFKVEVPGTYVLVDHSLSRAFNKGALGMLKAAGPEDRVIYSGKEIDAVYFGAQAEEGSEAARREAELKAKIEAEMRANPAIADLTLGVQLQRGKQVYMQTCFACHLPDGKGIPAVFPPLAGSDYLAADRERAIRTVIKGLSGPIAVNGTNYNNVMTPLGDVLNDQQIADVLTYVYNSWGNKGDAFTADQVKAVRSQRN
jgi:nitrite reductase (NO-forming)